MVRVCSDATASLDVTFKSNWCGPPMPCGIVKLALMVVRSPGAMVVEPTTGLGGQQPATVTIDTLSMTSGASPTFLTVNSALTGSP